ncbi:hypothetical protein E2C01_098066 [Portunus trituberculatus]|uniref:Uncharacterized protein n=1 Tax=Portunus trituberculatus TaxID=210409 RepID=A0A5B7KB75_PORTR|nr:hypothetical protein [Portunus trituberculatus]
MAGEGRPARIWQASGEGMAGNGKMVDGVSGRKRPPLPDTLYFTPFASNIETHSAARTISEPVHTRSLCRG